MPRTGRPRTYADTTKVTLRIEDEMLEKIDAIADRMNVSRSDAMRAMVQYVIDSVESGNFEITSYFPG